MTPEQMFFLPLAILGFVATIVIFKVIAPRVHLRPELTDLQKEEVRAKLHRSFVAAVITAIVLSIAIFFAMPLLR
ncbi:MAG: hypothetical protein KDK35_16400 [Leptospiraceae bacterium]|nr:hypothetical protein [Leptospiraceae bacterium]